MDKTLDIWDALYPVITIAFLWVVTLIYERLKRSPRPKVFREKKEVVENYKKYKPIESLRPSFWSKVSGVKKEEAKDQEYKPKYKPIK